MKTTLRFILAALVPVAALAQAPDRPPRPGFGPPRPPFGFEMPDPADAKLVKGLPYKAEDVTEVSQTLADGNQILRTMSATVYRDSEGRTRREMPLRGPAAAQDGRRHVFIADPVAGAAYLLEPDTRTARRVPAPGDRGWRRGGEPGDGPRGDHAERNGPMETLDNTSLGTQTIEGLEATGTRTTATIPAGAIGNVKPIQVVSERWVSPELQVVVLSTRRDPRFGVVTHRLKAITRSEPDKSLFEVPTGYTVREGPPPGGPPPGRPQERP